MRFCRPQHGCPNNRKQPVIQTVYSSSGPDSKHQAGHRVAHLPLCRNPFDIAARSLAEISRCQIPGLRRPRAATAWNTIHCANSSRRTASSHEDDGDDDVLSTPSMLCYFHHSVLTRCEPVRHRRETCCPGHLRKYIHSNKCEQSNPIQSNTQSGPERRRHDNSLVPPLAAQPDSRACTSVLSSVPPPLCEPGTRVLS